MKALLPFSSLCCFGSFALAQKTVIQGQITDKSKTPLVGANIALRNTYDGATANAEGRFQFETEETGTMLTACVFHCAQLGAGDE